MTSVIGRLQKEKNLITVCLVITNYDINGQNNENVEKRVVGLSCMREINFK